MSDTRIEPIMIFSCCECGDDHGHEAEDLRWYNDQLWCDECWYHEDPECDWSGLERFVPKVQQENAELRKLVEQTTGALKAVAGVSCNFPSWFFDGGKKSIAKRVKAAIEAAKK